MSYIINYKLFWNYYIIIKQAFMTYVAVCNLTNFDSNYASMYFFQMVAGSSEWIIPFFSTWAVLTGCVSCRSSPQGVLRALCHQPHRCHLPAVSHVAWGVPRLLPDLPHWHCHDHGCTCSEYTHWFCLYSYTTLFGVVPLKPVPTCT